MFFFTYLGRELRRRMRQAVVIALGLAVGIGLVVTVTAASAGVKNAEASVLRSLYGVGTDITVTGSAPSARRPGSASTHNSLSIGPNGAESCTNGKCHSADGETIDMIIPEYNPFRYSDVAAVAKLRHVAAAAGGLTLTVNEVTIPKNFGKPGSSSAPPTPNSFTVDGVDVADSSLGPLSAGKITSGHSFSSADADRYVAVVDSDYAISNKLKVGDTVKVDNKKFTVIGIVSQPQGSSPPDIYLPLARAQALKSSLGHTMANMVNTIYVTAASASDIPAVSREIKKLFPHATVTTAASLASDVTGSLSSAAKLINDFGRWLAVLVLIAAFAVASLLTLAAVSRRVREFGTLKALGWRSRRIIGQVLGESVITGIIGGAAGIGLGFLGAALITADGPKLPATLPGSGGSNGQFQGQSAGGPPGGAVHAIGPASVTHTVNVILSAQVTAAAIVAAVVLAIAGGLIAGSLGSWRIARLRPADALSRVA
jgi:putative ABC transport system permease protein